MNTGSIALRYCRALFEEARLAAIDAEIYGAFGVLHQNMQTAPDLQSVLISPRISKEKKLALMKTASQCTVPLWLRFLTLVLEHGRENLLRLMVFSFRDLYRAYYGIDRVVLQTAVPMNVRVLNRVTEKVKAGTGREVELVTEVRPDLIGGFCLRIGDVLYDYSYRTKLQNIRRQLWNR